jgi:VanZ family protein
VAFILRVLAFFIGLGVAGAGLFVLAFRFPHAWMPMALGAFATVLIGLVRWSPIGPFAFAYSSTWLVGAVALWLLSSNIDDPATRGLLALGAFCLLVTLFGLFALKGQSQRVALWLVGLLLIGLLVSYFSGPPGKLGILAILLQKLGISGDTAPYVVRKIGHFTLYGLLGWLAARASIAGGNKKAYAVLFALVMAAGIAGYDELRQSTIPVRVGSPTDVLIDLSGALFFALLTRAGKQKAPKRQP